MNISTKVINDKGNVVAALLRTSIYKDGVKVAQNESNISLKDEYTFEQTIKVDNPELWDIDNPQLYSAKVEIIGFDGSVVDCITEKFGIRDIKYSAQTGLLLNGKEIKLSGGCIHHDNGCIFTSCFLIKSLSSVFNRFLNIQINGRY